jgi:hypothetical protein
MSKNCLVRFLFLIMREIYVDVEEIEMVREREKEVVREIR